MQFMMGIGIELTVNNTVLFNGYITSSRRTSRGSYSYECRSITSIIATPFMSDRSYKIERGSTSHELFNRWAAENGVNIEYGQVEIDFNTRFTRNGTIADAILGIAAITKADVWVDKDDTIQIQPKPYIASKINPIIETHEIIDFIPLGQSITPKLVNTIYIQTKDYGTLCDIQVRPDTGIGFMKISSRYMDKPTVTSGTIAGDISTETFTESGEVHANEVIVRGAISDILSITLNGNQLNYHDVIDNTIIFTNVIDGFYEISYRSYGYAINAKRVGDSWTFQSSCGGGWWKYRADSSDYTSSDEDTTPQHWDVEYILELLTGT
jgi:hypothetical protein